MFIVIEGIDASGKATQSKLLHARARAAGFDPTLFSFPRYETPLGQVILRHLKGETLLSCAEGVAGRHSDDPMMFQALMVADKCAASALVARADTNGMAVCDRWWPSAYAYGAAAGISRTWLMQMHDGLPQPHLSVLLDLPVEEAAKRRPEARDRFERDADMLHRVRGHYRQMWTSADATSQGDWDIIDATQSADTIHEIIWEKVMRFIAEDYHQ